MWIWQICVLLFTAWCVCVCVHSNITQAYLTWYAAMLQATLLEQQQMYSNVPSPRNGHRPLSSTPAISSGGAPPPVPPRTYSQRALSNGRPHSYGGASVPAKSMKKYRLEDFQFVKLLGKGSFGKVHSYYLCYIVRERYSGNVFQVDSDPPPPPASSCMCFLCHTNSFCIIFTSRQWWLDFLSELS